MRTITSVAALVFLAIVAIPAAAAELRVRVTDAEGSLVENAKVTWIYRTGPPVAGPGNLSTWTAKSGVAHFGHVHAGVHRIIVQKAGYVPTIVSPVPVSGDLRQPAVVLSVILNRQPGATAGR